MATAQLDRLVEEQNKVWQRMLDIRDAAETGDRDMSAEERANWDLAEKRLSEVSGDIERLQRMAQLEQVDRSQIIQVTGEDVDGDAVERAKHDRRYAEAFDGYMRDGMAALAPEQQQLLRSTYDDLLAGSGRAQRAQAAGVGTAGGFMVPEGFRATITETMKAFGGILGLANVINTATGNKLPWPTNDDTGNEGEFLGENTAVTELDVTIGQRELDAFIVSSKMVKASLPFLQDSAIDVETWLARKLGERIGRRSARAFAVGTGVSQPEGITTNITIGKTGAGGQTTSVIYDDLVDLEHSVDVAYRDRGRARYLLHDDTLAVIRKLKDTQGRPLWVPVPERGFPATINGWEYTIDNSMPVPAASARSIVFGDINAGYIVRNVLSVQLLRLAERYAESLQVAFLAFARLDGMVDDASAIRAYEHAAA
ncbi:phage major capsid protein, HK97 family [Lentzea albidocapillata subsp. violacea]|uniref:Phage major capsid protein, HK97 family n=1 Tax=Lentzea albidocapillata subsp. violacea TaxID=128104 RepID=A0A1G9AT39_9PSEU|nr:phage major capsid protein [Lentzea albidocapillata]SDK30472.1 phage major capsid protein, HK97 family [Lentzea albidocapillata subsp. violacea]